MIRSILFFLMMHLFCLSSAQVSYDITFMHDGKLVYGTFSAPSDSDRFPTIIINAGSGPNDRDGTLPMIGGNVACLYPDLLGDTLRPYKELANAMVAAGYAVLRYDKLEFTYPTTLGTITFHKLWLPVESAIDYVKTRTDVDTNNIILIGHSEGSTLIPFIARDRTDIRALISIAGARTPFDSIFAYQIVNIAKICNGDTALAQFQANQILAYFNLIRSNTWNSSTPPLFGVPASVWYDYVVATDPVADHYNAANLCTVFIGLGLDINVPPAELVRFENEITITDDFWSIPGLIHYMTTSDDPHISVTLTDTIIHALNQCLITGLEPYDPYETMIEIIPNPFRDYLDIIIDKSANKKVSYIIKNSLGTIVFSRDVYNKHDVVNADFSSLPSGIYYLSLFTNEKETVRKIIKQ